MGDSKTILVTGGAGYIGSHTVLTLLEHGYSVVVVDNLVNACRVGETGIPESLKRVEKLTGKKIEFFDVDILDLTSLREVFEKFKFQCVIHFAALKSVGESCEKPLTYYHNNITGSLNLLQVMQEFQVSRFIFSSSSTVYGSPQFLPFTESHPTGQGCTNPYGKSKYFVEEILKDLAASNKDWTIISLRYFNPVGSHPSGEIGEDPNGIPNNLMPYIAQVAVGRRDKLQVFGDDYDTKDGSGVRDYIHIMDLAAGHVTALDKLLGPKSKAGFTAYNLGTGTGYSVFEMVAAFSRASNKKIPYEVVARREGDIASSYCDASLARAELQWEAKHGLDKMCEDTWRWQAKNPLGYQKIFY